MRPATSTLRSLATVMTLLLMLVVPAVATADQDDDRCASAVQQWVLAASRAMGVQAQAVSCHLGFVRVRLQPTDSPHLDVEVTDSPGPAFRRAGALRVSPIVQVSDFQQLPLAQRTAYEALYQWIATHPQQVDLSAASQRIGFSRPVPLPGVQRVGPLLWLLAIAGLLAARLRHPVPLPRTDLTFCLGLLSAALALRLAYGAFLPFHVYGQGGLWLHGALRNPGLIANYGPGYAEVYAPIAWLNSAQADRVLFATNAVLSSLAPLLLFALGRLCGLDFRRAALASLLLLVDPVTLRFAATEAYQVPIVALTLAAMVAAVAGVLEFASQRRWRAGVLVLSAGLLAAQAARIHPIAWFPTMLIPTAAFAATGERPLRQRLLHTLVVGGVLAVVGLLTSGRVLLAVMNMVSRGALMRPSMPGSGRNAVIAGGLLAAMMVVSRPRWLAMPGALALGTLLASRHNFAQSTLWLIACDRLLLCMPMLAVVAIVPEFFLERRSVRIAGVVVLLSWPVIRTPWIRARAVDQLEYQWTRALLVRSPSQCRIAYVGAAPSRLLYLPTYVLGAGADTQGRVVRIDAREPVSLATSLGSGRCTYYLRSSICSSAEGRAACARIESQLELETTAMSTIEITNEDTYQYRHRGRVDLRMQRVRAVRAVEGQ